MTDTTALETPSPAFAGTQSRPLDPDANPSPVAPAPPLPFTFTGNAREYFRIWIVNLFLSIVTLGIFYVVWMFVQSRWVRRIDPESPPPPSS